MSYSDPNTWRLIDNDGNELEITDIKLISSTDFINDIQRRHVRTSTQRRGPNVNKKKTQAEAAEEFHRELVNLGLIIANTLRIPQFAKWLNDKLEHRRT